MDKNKQKAIQKKIEKEELKKEKILLTLPEAAAYTGIGVNTLRKFTNKHTSLIIFVGRKRLLKKDKLTNYLLNHPMVEY